MSDEPVQPPMPPLPAIVEFNQQLLEQWVAIPAGDRIVAELTRQDVDHLLFGLLRSNDATTALERTLVHWSNGELPEANRDLAESRRLTIESQNYIRQFFSGLMISTLRARNAR